MKLIFAAALLFSGVTFPAWVAGQEEEEFNLPVPAVPAQPPGAKKAQPSAAAAAPVKKAPVKFCDTIDKKLAAYSQKKKGFKKVSWNNPDPPAVKEKKRQVANAENKALELCRLTRAQRAKAEKLRAGGADGSAETAGEMLMQADFMENKAEEFFLKAKTIREELDPPPALKKRAGC